MSFTDEIKEDRSAAKKTVETKTESESKQPSDIDKGLQASEFDLQSKEETAGTESAQSKEEPQKKPSLVRIAGKEFSSYDDALKFAEELALAQARDQGLVEGLTKAKQVQEAPPEVTKSPEEVFFEEIEEVLFSDPKQALLKLTSFYEDRTKRQIEEKAKEYERRAEVEVNRKKLWNTFYAEHSDLSDFSDYVETIYAQEYDNIKDKSVNEALEIVAKKTREIVERQRDRFRVRTDVPSKPANVASPSNGVSIKQQAPGPELLDFADQIRKLRRKGIKQIP